MGSAGCRILIIGNFDTFLDPGRTSVNRVQAALDVFASEPPPPDHPLVGRPDVVCTPHLGASTAEAQEDVSIEVAEVVVSALKVCAPPSWMPEHKILKFWWSG